MVAGLLAAQPLARPCGLRGAFRPAQQRPGGALRRPDSRMRRVQPQAATPGGSTADGAATSTSNGAAEPVKDEAAPVAAAEPPAAASAASAGPSSHPISVDELFNAQDLIEELSDSSQWAGKGVFWFAAQVALAALIVVPPFTLTGLVDLVGTLLITGGLVFIAYGVFSLGRQLSPLPAPRRNHKLVTTGMYGYVRHPMYGGLLCAGLGLAIVSRNECRLALTALLWLVLDRKASFEEAALIKLYGTQYEAYKQKVARFLPFLY